MTTSQEEDLTDIHTRSEQGKLAEISARVTVENPAPPPQRALILTASQCDTLRGTFTSPFWLDEALDKAEQEHEKEFKRVLESRAASLKTYALRVPDTITVTVAASEDADSWLTAARKDSAVSSVEKGSHGEVYMVLKNNEDGRCYLRFVLSKLPPQASTRRCKVILNGGCCVHHETDPDSVESVFQGLVNAVQDRVDCVVPPQMRFCDLMPD